ncbi:hypothetical protein [Pseudonocardia sp. T1-2H]|uniref:hypothetical protein n=1 Tax=Pseudonocardia sp. T1-2H TaxID=3128899 RepID=UPI0031019FC1
MASGNDVYATGEATGRGGSTDVFFARSTDSGRNFNNETNISNNSGPSEFLQIVVSEDRVVVTWRDATIPGLGFEIFFAQGG